MMRLTLELVEDLNLGEKSLWDCISDGDLWEKLEEGCWEISEGGQICWFVNLFNCFKRSREPIAKNILIGKSVKRVPTDKQDSIK